MKVDYVIVQAGGRGERLGYLTDNKPKALVPVDNLPMLFHLFRKFPDKRFVIIGDYKKEVLREYLSAFAEVKYIIAETGGAIGTSGGIRAALKFIPPGRAFMLIWSDLVLDKNFCFPQEAGDYIGISQTFPCRWRYENGRLAESPSTEHGVAGLFLFQEKKRLMNVPDCGELVRWMAQQGFAFRELGLAGTREFGVLEDYQNLEADRCRPFNRITVTEDRIVKEAIDEQGRQLAAREREWYQAVGAMGYDKIPAVYQYEPLVMERIQGKNIYEGDFSSDQKRVILKKLVRALRKLHQMGGCPADCFSLREAYYAKTLRRLERIRNLVPFAEREFITINGRKCRNVFYCRQDLERRLLQVPCKEFRLLHGDCTFSNLMVREDLEPVLIDPRGYFGFQKLYGDPLYDWAKLYYSIKGNYDRFNRREFRLEIQEEEIRLDIVSNGWEDLEQDLLKLLAEDARPQDLQLIHAVIWLSLTTYAWQDYDSICGAFYNGLYYLEEVL